MQIIEKYFPALTPQQTGQFSQLASLYNFWNERINVISRKDIGNLYLHHVLHSMAISRIISFRNGTRIIDAGTGGGFPGVPLAILFPGTHFMLVDSIKKKILVVENIIKETGLTNCEVRQLRLEELRDKADFVVCRAVSAIPEVFGLVKKNIVPGSLNELLNGLLALKGGDLSEEIKPMGAGVKVFELSEYYSEEYYETKKLVYVPRTSAPL